MSALQDAIDSDGWVSRLRSTIVSTIVKQGRPETGGVNNYDLIALSPTLLLYDSGLG